MTGTLRILTDSAADFSLDQLQAEDVQAVPMNILCGNDTLSDDKTFPMNFLWEKMKNGTMVKTSQPSPAAFLDFFQAAKAAGDAVLCITVSGALSGTYQAAQLAKSMAQYDPIYLVDSRCAAAGEKLLVLEACRLRREGRLNAAEIVQKLEAFRTRIRLFACINTLEHLVRGGRLSKTAGRLGTALNVKPVFTLSPEGQIVILHKTLGMKKGMECLSTLVKACLPDPHFPIIPLYACDKDHCLSFLRRLLEQGGPVPGAPEEIGASIGCHIGPGGLGIAYVARE